MKFILSKKSESSQALIFIAVALVGLLGMTALAVDGAMIYSDRREVQSAADNAVMSAAAAGAMELDNENIYNSSFDCGLSGVIESEIAARDAAINRAGTNGMAIDTDIADNNGVQVSCHIVADHGFYDRYIDVTVKITHRSETAFSRFVFPEGIENTVEAVSRYRPRRSLALGNTIASLGPDCPGIQMTGNAGVEIWDGGVYSNTCLELKGNVDIDVHVDYGGISYRTTYKATGNVSVSPSPELVTEPLEMVDIPTPECIALPDYGALNLSGNSTVTINPGRYDKINLTGNSKLTLNPGLYCLYGDFLTAGNQVLKVSGNNSDPDGVTIYMASGKFHMSGNSDIQLRAPSQEQPPAIKGLLIYAPPGNTNTMQITGNSSSHFRGTVYIPDGTISAVGNGSTDGFDTELIGAAVTLTGNASMRITDNPANNYTRPPLIELVK
ncbi:MAG: Tad domain-containing protein [Anaerolineaceae bacterium]|nr:Tad domain-containing protein [Anaerolineaceae bacterium]MBN2676997.1 Tad domain-containing protein [Anaerolineaceae bacterium]